MADGKDNLKPFKTVEEAREAGRKGGIASGKAKREKKLMSTIYAEFLAKEHNVIGQDGKEEKIDGQKLLNKVITKVLAKSDSGSVSMMKEIRQGTEGDTLKIETDIEAAGKKLKDFFELTDDN